MMTELSNACLYNNTFFPQQLHNDITIALRHFGKTKFLPFFTHGKLFYWVIFGYQKKWNEQIYVS